MLSPFRTLSLSFLLLMCHGISAQDTCTACFTIMQTAPFQGTFHSCTTGGTAPVEMGWFFDGTDTLHGSTAVRHLNGPGSHTVCHAAIDANNAWCFTCKTVLVDTDGNLTLASPPACQANFWMVQAYDVNDSTATPIPHEVWVLNVSDGGTGDFELHWDFGDGGSSGEQYTDHAYDGPGPYQLCLTIADQAGCTSTYCHEVAMDDAGLLNGLAAHPPAHQGKMRTGGFTLRVIPALPMGIGERTVPTGMRQWPNPVQDMLHVQFDNRRFSPVQVSVIDPTGRTVVTETQVLPVGLAALQLDTRALVPGVYLLRVGTGPGSTVQRFVKAR